MPIFFQKPMFLFSDVDTFRVFGVASPCFCRAERKLKDWWRKLFRDDNYQSYLAVADQI